MAKRNVTRSKGPGPYFRVDLDSPLAYYDAALLELSEATSVASALTGALVQEGTEHMVGAASAIQDKLLAVRHYLDGARMPAARKVDAEASHA